MKFLINCLLFPKIFLDKKVVNTETFDDSKDNILFFAGNGVFSSRFLKVFNAGFFYPPPYNLFAVDIPLKRDDFSAQGDINI